MSAPDTKIDKQVKRHVTPLTGMMVAVAIATAAFLGFLAWSAIDDADTSGAQNVTEPAPDASGG